jgi:hypothetical protein
MAKRDGTRRPKQIPVIPAQSGKPFTDPSDLLPAAHTSTERLCWRFTHIDHDGPWGTARIDHTTLLSLIQGLTPFESMKINDLFHGAQPRGKSYDIEKIPDQRAQPRLEALNLSDMTRICSLRPQGKPRIWGFLHGNVFHLVWFDLEHEVWPTALKHT